MKKLHVAPLTAEAFTDFGDVIEARGEPSYAINYGMADRYHALARVDVGESAAAVISIVNSRQQDLPHQVSVVERHPLGSQAFIPRERTPFVVVVAAPSESFQPDQLHAFVTNGEQGINYHTGTWHGLLLTPFADMSFICVDRDGAGNNCQEIQLAADDRVWLDIG